MIGCSNGRIVALEKPDEGSNPAFNTHQLWTLFFIFLNRFLHLHNSNDNNNDICFAELFGGLNTIKCIQYLAFTCLSINISFFQAIKNPYKSTNLPVAIVINIFEQMS